MAQPEAEMNWLELFVSALGGSIVTFLALRTKIALMDKRIDDLEKHVAMKLDAIDRKQVLLLGIVADIANKVGVDKRFSDIIVKFLKDEEGIDDTQRS
jgi:hypothetical protein